MDGGFLGRKGAIVNRRLEGGREGAFVLSIDEPFVVFECRADLGEEVGGLELLDDSGFAADA